MKMKQLGVLVFCLLFIFMAMTVSARHNHFRVYHAKSAEPFEPIVVELKDQFDPEFKKVKLVALVYFGNPVAKKHKEATHPIADPNAHLTWYKFAEPEKPTKKIVKIKNQFGTQKLVIGEAKYLVVPTQKIERGSEFPKEFNHFKAYQVLEGDFEPVYVELKDQFDKKPVKVKLLAPHFFCNPVEKIKDKYKAPIYDKRYHLACYLVDPKAYADIKPKSLDIKNQFGKSRIHPGTYFLLCVPTEKLGFE